MVYWWAEHRRRMSDGEVVQESSGCYPGAEAFAYSIVYIKPQP